MNRSILLVTLAAMLGLAGCQSLPVSPIRTETSVDLNRFMGDWYVIANIPTFIEKGAYNAVESYRLTPDGKVATHFRFRDGGFDGPLKVYQPTGYVRHENNAVWGMQFIWPFKSEYRIVYLDDDYTQTVIGRSKRDYVWIMARTPDIPESDYRRIVEQLAEAGYDTKRIQRVPQRWPEPGKRNQDS